MKSGVIHIYTGDEKSSSKLALGKAVSEAALGKYVIMIRFFNESLEGVEKYTKSLEPELKIFSFYSNIFNGMNFARKILATVECDLLILDEILDLIREGIISKGELEAILEHQEETNIILTGKKMEEKNVPFLSVDSPRFECYDINRNQIM